MKQFDVFRNPNSGTSRVVPWLMVIQSDLLDEFPTRMVAPLVRPQLLGTPSTRLNPTFRIGGESAVMLTQQLGSIAKRSLCIHVTSLESHRSEIMAAIDFLLAGI